MNVQLLRTIRDEIAASPSRFSATHWGWARNAKQVIHDGDEPEGFCCCIAGHALLLSGRNSERELVCQSGICYEDGYLWQRAAEAVELSREQANLLFFPSQWCNPYKEQYYLGSRSEEASVCAAYIDHFIEQYAPGDESAAARAIANDQNVVQAV